MGKIKPAPEKPGAGDGGIQDFFAVSQITINGRRIINRMIKRGSPPRCSLGRGADRQAGSHIVLDRTYSVLGIGCNLSGPSRPGCAC